MSGKQLRLNRFLYRDSKRGLIVPIDHGLTLGPLPGIQSVREIGRWIQDPAICGVIVHKGMAERLAEARLLDGLGLMIHLNGMTSLAAKPDTKEALTSVETALRLGADGVSFQVNFDGENDSRNLQLMGRMVDEAAAYGLPVLAMVYDKVEAKDQIATQRLRHLIRATIEMGCDAVKIAPPAQLSLLPGLLANLSEDIPIFLAGGALGSRQELSDLVKGALKAGAAGVCVGRNVFQRPDASQILGELRDLIRPPSVVSESPFYAGALHGAH